MQRRHILLGAAAAVSACSSLAPARPLYKDDQVTQNLCPADPDNGYNFPYVLQTPAHWSAKSIPYLFVETNNSGPISAEFGPHVQPASELARQGLGGRVSVALEAPLLMPVFPRDPTLYTHSLGRSTLFTQVRTLRRLDLQLLAMTNDAKRRLAAQARTVHQQLVFTGFSASAMFATRLAMLHPKQVAAVVAGGLNGFVMLPIARLSETQLSYPLGVLDLREVSGHEFDEQAWREIPQLLFMGALDENDAVDFDDSYSSTDRQVIHNLLGKRMIPERWRACEDVYRAFKAPARFKVFPNLGHGTNRAVHQECAAFIVEVTGSVRRG